MKISRLCCKLCMHRIMLTYTQGMRTYKQNDCVQMVPWLSVWSVEWYEDTFTVFSVLSKLKIFSVFGHDMVTYEKDVWCHDSVCVKWGVIRRYLNGLFSCVWTKYVDMSNRRDVVSIWCHDVVCVKWGVMWRNLNCLFSCVWTKYVDIYKIRDFVYMVPWFSACGVSCDNACEA